MFAITILKYRDQCKKCMLDLLYILLTLYCMALTNT